LEHIEKKMSESIDTRELAVARRAAMAGGEVAAKYFREGCVMRGKSSATGLISYNLVSDADIQAEHAIVDVIRQAYPDHGVLGEEAHQHDAGAEHLWIVDPIDGTNNFAHRIPHFAISIAYYRSGQAVCGAIYNPIREDWYTAVRGQGAYHNGREVRVAASAELTEALIGVGFYYDRGAMMEATLAAIGDLFRRQIHGIRRFGTASLDLCFVAEGMFGAYFEYELSPWDFAAGRLFVEEAGGRVTTCRGELLPLGKTSVLASNGLLHEAVLAVVEGHCPR
jgi:myo-inositol-1(or 4)-monophosphatase